MSFQESPLSKQETIPMQIRNAACYLINSHKRAIVATILLTIGFISPLKDLLHLSLTTDLYSHVVLIPIIVIYLINDRKAEFDFESKPNPILALLPLLIGFLALYRYLSASPTENLDDKISPAIFSYVCFIWTICVLSIRRKTLPKTLFALILLIFIVPFSTHIQLLIDTFFQHTSAETAYWMLEITDTTVLRIDKLIFQLPGITIQVATECSGIRSSLVLFIVSLVAGALFLKSPWKRAVLVVFVIPLAIARNAFRIFVIAQLCVHIDPEMIDSYIHHKGGPIFFALSLIPFALVLLLLWRSENPKSLNKRQNKGTKETHRI